MQRPRQVLKLNSLFENDENARAKAAYELTEIAEKAEFCLLILISALKDRSPLVRENAAWTLKEWGPRISEISKNCEILNPKQFLLAYGEAILQKLRWYSENITFLRNTIEKFSCDELQIAATLLLKLVLLGKKRGGSHLKSERQRLHLMLVEYVNSGDRKEKELIEFIEKSISKEERARKTSPDKSNIPLQIKKKIVTPNTIIIYFQGTLSIENILVFERSIFSALDRGAREIFLDLSQVSFMDSSILGNIMIFIDLLEKLDGKLAITETSPSISDLFDMLGVASVPIFALPEEAEQLPRLDFMEEAVLEKSKKKKRGRRRVEKRKMWEEKKEQREKISLPKDKKEKKLPPKPGKADFFPKEKEVEKKTPPKPSESKQAFFRQKVEEKIPEKKEEAERPKQRHRLLVKPEELDITERIQKALLEQEEGLTQRVKCAKAPMRKKARAIGFIQAIGQIFLLPIYGVFYLFKGVYFLSKQIYQTLCKELKYLKNIFSHFIHYCQRQWQKIRESETPVFELFLSEDAGRPGPVERLIAQSTILMKGLQVTIGLHFILLANLFDSIIEIFTAYIHGIFSTWKMARTIKRRIDRERSNTQVTALAEDLSLARIYLSRMLKLSSFSLEENEKLFSQAKDWKKISASTFPLKLALEIRGHLDQMKRDLAFLTMDQVRELVQGTLQDFFLSFIPNPIDFLVPWKDLFLLSFFLKYSRVEIEKMYVAWLVEYQNTIDLLQQKYGFQETLKPHHVELMNHEKKLLSEVKYTEMKALNLQEAVEKNRENIKRLIYMLCKPQLFMYPRHWSRIDLLRELAKGEIKVHCSCSIEWERWLTTKIDKALQKVGYKPSIHEKHMRLQERLDFRARHRLQHKLSQSFVL